MPLSRQSQDASGPKAVRRRRVVRGIKVLFVVVIACRWVTGTANPVFTIPPKLAPSPNAFDTYCRAGQMLQNGAEFATALDPQKGYTLAQQEQLVTANAQALQTLRSGFSQEYLDTKPRTIFSEEHSISSSTPYLEKYRNMARLFRLEDRVKAQQGDWNGAVDSDLDCIRMGEEVPHGAPVTGMLTGMACQAIGRRDLWDYVDRLDTVQSRKALVFLQNTLDRNVPFSDTLTEEKYYDISILKELFRGDAGSMSKDTWNDDGTSPPTPKAFAMFFMIYSKKQIAQNYTHYMDQLIANSRLPYALHSAAPPLPNDPITQQFAPVLNPIRIKEVANQTQNGLLLVTLALHAYQRERGRYPQSLQDLTPNYLKQLPNDPFALKGTFQYHLYDTDYLLYSVGPDGKDDGGKLIDDPARATATNSSARYSVYENSKGDIVAGKNF